MTPPTPNVEVVGLERTISAQRQTAVKDAMNIAEGVRKALDIVGKRSDVYVPVDKGDLKASKFTKVEGAGFNAKGTIGYSARHAVPVHERLDLAHRSPTCAKFLERAIRESRGTITAMLKRQIQVGK
jgi:hypothetical protein